MYKKPIFSLSYDKTTDIGETSLVALDYSYIDEKFNKQIVFAGLVELK